MKKKTFPNAERPYVFHTFRFAIACQINIYSLSIVHAPVLVQANEKQNMEWIK